jgi:di/tricarboxylate transporter
MAPGAWTTVGVLAAVTGFLMFTRVGPDLILLGALTLLLTFGVIGPADALAGFANEGMATVAVLFVVAAGLRETGAMALVVQQTLGRPKTIVGAQARMMFPVAAMSAFLNNTPIVAMMLPVIDDWSRRTRISPSKLMIPLSYATILGGLCTLIGTSTNLVVNGLLVNAGLPGQGLFDMTWLGLPCCVVGLLYILAMSPWLLPDRKPAAAELEDPRSYTVEMLVEPGSGLIGQTIEQAGLRHLPGLYLMEIDRDGELLVAVPPQERLRGNDRLVFVGVVESVKDLQKLRGLKPATDQVFKLNAPRSQRCLIEAVVSNSCPLVGMTIREGRFRTVYNAAVIAVSRNGERLRQKVGDIEVQAGDTLLLEAHPSFADQMRNSRDFFLVSRLEDSTPPRHERAPVALLILIGMVVAAGAGWLSMFNAALIAGALLLLTRCVRSSVARRSVDWQVLIVIAASFGLGRAMERTGAAAEIAGRLILFAGTNPYVALAVVYVVTMLFTEVMSHIAAAVVVFPIALATARSLGVEFTPFAMAMMMAASCGFATPIGYQTNLMVYGPGGYRYTDYLRFGGPLNLLVMATTLIVAPLVWPFHP